MEDLKRQQAVDLLVRFRNCKLDKNKAPMTDQGMNYILMVMSDGKPVTASALADEMNVSMARMTALIQKMEEKGYVLRKTSEEDKRVSYITLTEDGMRMSSCLLEYSFNVISKLIDKCGYEKVYSCLDVLYGLRDILNEEQEDYYAKVR